MGVYHSLAIVVGLYVATIAYLLKSLRSAYSKFCYCIYQHSGEAHRTYVENWYVATSVKMYGDVGIGEQQKVCNPILNTFPH